MLKEYIFKVTTEGYISVSAESYEDAKEWLEENVDKLEDVEIVDLDLIDVEEQDVDAICDEMRIERWEQNEGDRRKFL